MNSPTPYMPLNEENNKYSHFTPKNGSNTSQFHQKSENFYANQSQEKFDSAYRYDSKNKYDDKNYYSNIDNVARPQEPTNSDRSNRNIVDRLLQDVVYSNIEPAEPIPVPQPIKNKNDIIYSNIQWKTTKPENMYCNIPAQDLNTGMLFKFHIFEFFPVHSYHHHHHQFYASFICFILFFFLLKFQL